MPGAIQQLLDLPRVKDDKCVPGSEGAVEAARLQGGANLTHKSDPRFDTADFSDRAPGNLRVDYVLPSRGLPLRGCGVFWPVKSDPLSRLTGEFSRSLPPPFFPSSDHRLVWIDVKVPGGHVGHRRP